MIFSRAFFVLSFAALAFAVPVAQNDPVQVSNAGLGNVVGVAADVLLKNVNVNALSNNDVNNND